MSTVRFDRLLSLCVGKPLGRGNRGGTCLPILMYHSVSSDLEESVEPYYRVVTNPRRFAEQMQWLSDLGCQGVALEEALAIFDDGKLSGRRPVAITFDDGFRDFYTHAWPVLRRHGFTASVYLPTGSISWERALFLGRECLTWDEIRDLRQEGICFGSHTVSHPKLYSLSWDKIASEITDSKECIQEELEAEVTSFAYPYAFPQEDGDFVQRFSEILRQAGYRHCATTVIGRARMTDNRYSLKRLPVNSCDDKALFAAKLDGAYDWLGGVQAAYRQFRRVTNAHRRRPQEKQTKATAE